MAVGIQIRQKSVKKVRGAGLIELPSVVLVMHAANGNTDFTGIVKPIALLYIDLGLPYH